MAKSKNKRTRTVSVRQDYRKGGIVKDVLDNIRKGLAVGGKTNKTDEDDIRFGAVPKDQSNPVNKSNVDIKAATNNKNPIVAEPEPEPNPSPAPTEPTPSPTTPEPTEPTPEPTEPTDPPESTPEPVSALDPAVRDVRITESAAEIEARAKGKVPEEAIIPTAEQAGFERDAQGNLILDNEGNPIPLTPQKINEMAPLTTVGINKAAQILDEEVERAEAFKADDAQQLPPAEMEAKRAEEAIDVEAAERDVTKEIEGEDVERVTPINAAAVEIQEGALMAAAQGELSADAIAPIVENAGLTLSRVTRAKKQLRNAGLSEEDITELGTEPEALEDRLTDFTEEQRGIIEGLPEDALVSNQIDSLLEGIQEGEIPVWARPAVTSVEKMLAARGMSASTVGRDTLVNTIIQSALPIAQSNAQAIQASVAQQRGIEAQAFEADAQRKQQTALFNAGNVFQMDMANLNNEQQARLSDSKFLQTVSLTEANNVQQSIVQDAILMSQANLAEANLNQQAQINNAKNFLSMDLANLNNEQQAYMLKAQQEQQKMLSNQAAENVAEQFNAASENQTNQFMANLNNQISQYNATQNTAVSQFNATQENAAAARNSGRQTDIEKFNTQLQTQIEQFNSQQDFNKNQWNAQNATAVEASNVQWRRQVNTANTAVQNQINMQNAMNAFNMSSQSMSFLWQELRDQADFDFRAGENDKNRRVQLINTALANETDHFNLYQQEYGSFLTSLSGSALGVSI